MGFHSYRAVFCAPIPTGPRTPDFGSCSMSSFKLHGEGIRVSQAVAGPPELSRLKCIGHHHKGNTSSNALQTEQFLVCRVTSRYNHRFSDRTSIPRTKASSEILQPQILQLRHNNDYKPVKNIITKPT